MYFAEHKEMASTLNKIFYTELAIQGASWFLRLTVTPVDAPVISVKKLLHLFSLIPFCF